MTGSYLSRAICLTLLLLSLAGAKQALPDTIPKIDLSEPNPHGLESLPGIDDEEVGLLLKVAGPGPGDLEERLAATGISPDRLRIWAPYLGVEQATIGPVTGKIRASVGQKHRRPFRSRLRATHETRRVMSELVLEEVVSSSSSPADAIKEGRFVARIARSAAIWAGSLTAGIQGGNPWDDPLQRPGTASALPQRLRVRSSRSAHGVVGFAGPCGAALWHRKREGEGVLLSFTHDEHAVCYGTRPGKGSGVGGSFPLGGAIVNGLFHRPSRASDVLSIGVRATEEPSFATLSWAMRPRDSSAGARLDCGATRRVGRLSARASIACISSGADNRASSRGNVRLSWNDRSNRASLQGAWDHRRLSFSSRLDRPMTASLKLRLQLKGKVSKREVPLLFQVRSSRDSGSSRVELGLLGRTDPDLSWPGLGVRDYRGRSAALCRLDIAREDLTVRVEVLTALRFARGLRYEGVSWRLTFEQRGGS